MAATGYEKRTKQELFREYAKTERIREVIARCKSIAGQVASLTGYDSNLINHMLHGADEYQLEEQCAIHVELLRRNERINHKTQGNIWELVQKDAGLADIELEINNEEMEKRLL